MRRRYCSYRTIPFIISTIATDFFGHIAVSGRPSFSQKHGAFSVRDGNLFGTVFKRKSANNNDLLFPLVEVIDKSKSIQDVIGLSRGGEIEKENDDVEGNENASEPQELYLPGLLDANVAKSSSSSKTSASDYTITISSSKAKELSLNDSDVVAVIGRRRAASIANVSIKRKSTSSSTCIISKHLAHNLHIRDADKVKIVPIGKDLDDDDEEDTQRSGDLILINSQSKPSVAESVTFSPIDDSLNKLQMRELDGDEMPEEDII